MQTTDRNAQAADRLSILTARYEIAATIQFDFTKASRALRALIEDMHKSPDSDPALTAMLEEFRGTMIAERRAWVDKVVRLGDEAGKLNDQIQNGVFDNA